LCEVFNGVTVEAYFTHFSDGDPKRVVFEAV